LLPGLDLEPWVFGRVGTRPQFQIYGSRTMGSN
jgi:hypothetical protein